MKKFTPQNFAEVVTAYIDEQMRDKAEKLTSKGITATYDGSLNITFDKQLSEDKEQDRAGVIIKGGVILTAKGLKKKKLGEKLNVDDFYIINPVGKEL